MRLADAARRFDQVDCADAYNATTTFKAQLDLFDDSKRDGATVARRVLSVAPDVTIPARGVITAHDDQFIVGGLHKDSFGGAVIRKKFVAHRADGLAALQTIDQKVRSVTGSSAYSARLWVKDMKEVDQSSRLTGFFNLFFAPTETVAIGTVVTLNSRLHLVRQAYLSAAGFLLCEADELPVSAVGSAAYTDRSGQAYDAATDKMGALSPSTVPVLWHRFQSDFDYLQQGAEKMQEGDITVHVSKTSIATAGAGDTFVLNSVTWRVFDARDYGDNVWRLHARHA